MNEATFLGRNERILPMGRYFSMTWSLPTVHGGRTSALLHRSKSFVREGGVNVDILTFDSFRDYGTIREELRGFGKLIDGVRLRNLWEELPELGSSINPPNTSNFSNFRPLGDAPDVTIDSTVPGMSKVVKLAPGGLKLIQIDYLRPDGSLFMSDASPSPHGESPTKRSLILCNQGSEPVMEYTSSWQLYRFWLDQLIGDEAAHLIVDNKHVGTFMAGYSRPNAAVIYQVHDSHLQNASKGPLTELSGAGQVLLLRIDAFDGVVVLTDQQANDIRKRVNDSGNVHVIPNSRLQTLDQVTLSGRQRGHGILLAQLTERKQIDHAIAAISKLRDTKKSSVTLAIYGEGNKQDALEQLVAALGLEGRVSLMGHSHDPQSELSRSSFSLLTSSSESFGLVIVESMAAGCIPIVYDIHYGPAAIITHGVDGFIVEYGNVGALADAIAYFLNLSNEEVEVMRKAAVNRARNFSDDAIVRQWGRVLEDVGLQKAITPKDLSVDLIQSSAAIWTNGDISLRVHLKVSQSDTGQTRTHPTFMGRLSERGSEDFRRVQADAVSISESDSYEAYFTLEATAFSIAKPSVWDFAVEVHVGRVNRRIRVRIKDWENNTELYTTIHGNLSLRARG